MTTLKPDLEQLQNYYNRGFLTKSEYYRLVTPDFIEDDPFPLIPAPLFSDEAESALDHELELQFLAWEYEVQS